MRMSATGDSMTFDTPLVAPQAKCSPSRFQRKPRVYPFGVTPNG